MCAGSSDDGDVSHSMSSSLHIHVSRSCYQIHRNMNNLVSSVGWRRLVSLSLLMKTAVIESNPFTGVFFAVSHFDLSAFRGSKTDAHSADEANEPDPNAFLKTLGNLAFRSPGRPLKITNSYN